MPTLFYWITNSAALGLSIIFFFSSWLIDRNWVKRLTTLNITIVATFCALSVVLTNVVGYSQIFGLRIMIGNFVLFLTGMFFGPVAGVVIGIVTDGVGALIFLGGVYHAGFMLEKIIFGFLGALVFVAKTNKWWQVKVFLFLGVSILVQLFVITPVALWSTGGPGYVVASLIRKAIMFPLEWGIYPVLTIFSFRVLWLLTKKLPTTSQTIWATRNGDVHFFGKAKKTMLESLSPKKRRKYELEIKNQEKITPKKEV